MNPALKTQNSWHIRDTKGEKTKQIEYIERTYKWRVK